MSFALRKAKKLRSKTVEDFEPEARILCGHHGLDPDELIPYPDPNGYAVMRRRKRWINCAQELHAAWELYVLVS